MSYMRFRSSRCVEWKTGKKEGKRGGEVQPRGSRAAPAATKIDQYWGIVCHVQIYASTMWEGRKDVIVVVKVKIVASG
jgi:hypothetical protein